MCADVHVGQWKTVDCTTKEKSLKTWSFIWNLIYTALKLAEIAIVNYMQQRARAVCTSI